MEVVYSGKEVKNLINKKLEMLNSEIEELAEKLAFQWEFLEKSKKEYDTKGFFYKLTNKRPSLTQLLKVHSNPVYDSLPIEEEISKLIKRKYALEDNATVILNIDEITYFNT